MHRSQNHCSGRVSGIIGFEGALLCGGLCREVGDLDFDLVEEDLEIERGGKDCRLEEGDWERLR